eukprot:11669579-Alexandrium_andersonii.AAC.1
MQAWLRAWKKRPDRPSAVLAQDDWEKLLARELDAEVRCGALPDAEKPSKPPQTRRGSARRTRLAKEQQLQAL